MAATKRQIKERKNGDEADRSGNGSLTRKAYERELARLHGELVKLQQWVVAKGLKVVIVFEVRDGAGKGAGIGAIVGAIPHTGGALRFVEQRLEHVDVPDRRLVLHDHEVALEPGAGVDARLREERTRPVGLLVEGHEHEVPDLDVPVAVELTLGTERRVDVALPSDGLSTRGVSTPPPEGGR